jgi:hypothetical protein
MIIEAVRNYVVFTFVEDIYGDRFINSAGGAIILTSDDKSQTTYPRWGKVVNVGPDVTEITPGEYVLIEPGKWTTHFFVDGLRYWKTDEDKILCTADEPGSTY